MSKGYERVLYGDHGHYLELNETQANWKSFPNRIKRSKHAYYDLAYSSDWKAKMYIQKKTVQDRPNPPPEPLSTKNFRPGGYADYRPKFMYIAMADLARCKYWAPREYAAIARDDRPAGWKGPALSLRNKIADRLDKEAKGPDPALYPALAIFPDNYPIKQDHQIRSTWENTSWQANETRERNHNQLNKSSSQKAQKWRKIPEHCGIALSTIMSATGAIEH